MRLAFGDATSFWNVKQLLLTIGFCFRCHHDRRDGSDRSRHHAGDHRQGGHDRDDHRPWRPSHAPESFFQDGSLRALATPVRLVLKILNLDDMRDFWISDLNGECGQATANVSRPLMPAHWGEGPARRAS